MARRPLGWGFLGSLLAAGGGMPQPCLQSPADHSCPAWHHLLCQVLSHLTFHLTFITYNSYVYSQAHCTGDTKAQEAKGPAQAQIAWG